VYPLRRLRGSVLNWFTRPAREAWLEKLPFLIASVLAGAMAIRGQIQSGAMLSLAERDIPARIAVTLYGPAFYLWKTIVPLDLSPLYEWPVRFNPLAWPFLLSGLTVIALTVLLVRFRSSWPAGLILWLAYLVFLAPVLVPFQTGSHLAADRYTYLACTGWALLVGAVVARCLLSRSTVMAVGVSVLVVAMVAALVRLTYCQTRVWRDTWALWSHVLSVDANCWRAYGGLGAELRRRKDYDQALEKLNAALRINPDSVEVHNSIGSVYADQGHHAEALPHFRNAIKASPGLAAPHYNLAGALMQVDRIDEAIEELRKAIALNGRFAQAYHRLGDTMVLAAEKQLSLGKPSLAREHYTQAVKCYKRALELNPEDLRPQETARQVLNKLETIP
jgi:tetratricopeptide (TPR) repeat protein